MHLDFKFEVSDAAKIARSLASFANTDGGCLLIGVKDNGRISGIQSQEEHFMLKNAATTYCVPEVEFTSKEWNINGKKVLEVNIPKSTNTPHKSPDPNGKLKVYIRVDDQNMLANGVQMKIWNKLNTTSDINFVYSDDAKKLLGLFKDSDSLTIEEILPSLKLSRFRAENMLAELIIMKVIKMTINESYASYGLNDPTK